MAKKRRSNPHQHRPLTHIGERPFAVRPSGPRGISTRFNPAAPPPMPPWFRAKYPAAPQTEWEVWNWLVSTGHKRPDIDFVYQDPVLGGRNAGGQVLDFVMIDRAPYLAIFVNGDYWHFGGSTLKLQASLDAVENVRQFLHYDAIIVWESALKAGIDGVMRKALDGIQEPQALSVAR